jgi:hypothetical protein
MPVWLTLGALPFIYAFALVAGYGEIFTSMKVRNRSERRRCALVSASSARCVAASVSSDGGPDRPRRQRGAGQGCSTPRYGPVALLFPTLTGARSVAGPWRQAMRALWYAGCQTR